MRIGSKGDAGTVEQTNASIALSAALNANETDQRQPRPRAAAVYGTGVQAIGQKAESDQTADSSATSTQYHPSNTNTPVRIGSYGDDGDVYQTNLSLAASLAANHNDTDQSATQTQAGGECCAPAPLRASQCCSGGTGVQAIGQFAYNDQTANSTATSTQIAPCNVNAPVRIFSPGGGGSVVPDRTTRWRRRSRST